MPRQPRRIFISYRREDTHAIAGRIRDHLRGIYGRDNVFYDIDAIPYGVDFLRHIERSIASCDAVLVIIGRRWLKASDKSGKRRLEDPADVVRFEIATALRREIPVVPVLVDGAAMPKASKLPENIARLSSRNGLEIRHDPDFHTDMDRLIGRLPTGSGLQPRVSPGPSRGVSASAPPDPATLTRWAAARIDDGNLHEAIRYASQAISYDPASAEAYYQRARARRRNGDISSAIADYAEAIRLNPINPLAFNGRGIAHEAGADLDAAIIDFTAAIALDPKEAQFYENRGNALAAMGNHRAAEADLTEANRLRRRQ
jgi:tetratricopeptide (TPR) repeat protein